MTREHTGQARFERGSSEPASAIEPVTMHLHAGQLFASVTPSRISTVLGSCVAVCVIDPIRGAGGANHYLLPLHVTGALASPRFGNVAIEELLARMIALGSRKRDLVAKVFGGASPMSAERSGIESLGWQNVRVARRILAAERVRIIVEDVGGTRGRRLLFNTSDGCAWVRKL